MIGPMISPVVASQCLTVPSGLSAEDRLAIGAEGQALAAHVLTIENQPEGLAGVGIPEPHRVDRYWR